MKALKETQGKTASEKRKDRYQTYMIFFSKMDPIDRGIMAVLRAKAKNGQGKKTSGSLNQFVKQCILDELKENGEAIPNFVTVSTDAYRKIYEEVENANGSENEYKVTMNSRGTLEKIVVDEMTRRIDDGSFPFRFTDEEKKKHLKVVALGMTTDEDFAIIDSDSNLVIAYAYFNSQRQYGYVNFNLFCWRPNEEVYYEEPYSRSKEAKEKEDLLTAKQLMDKQETQERLMSYVRDLADKKGNVSNDELVEELIKRELEYRESLKKKQG